MISIMATIHISEADFARDMTALLGRVVDGTEIVIERGEFPIAIVKRPAQPHMRLLSESLRIAQQQGSTAKLDGGFGNDLKAVIDSHPEPFKNPWE